MNKGEWTEELSKAYRRGKIDGYGEGVLHGWDAARARIGDAFDALLSPLDDDEKIKVWRESVKQKRDALMDKADE